MDKLKAIFPRLQSIDRRILQRAEIEGLQNGVHIVDNYSPALQPATVLILFAKKLTSKSSSKTKMCHFLRTSIMTL